MKKNNSTPAKTSTGMKHRSTLLQCSLGNASSLIEQMLQWHIEAYRKTQAAIHGRHGSSTLKQVF